MRRSRQRSNGFACLGDGQVEKGSAGRSFHSVFDEELGLEGYLAIDSTVRGRSFGGIRIVPAISRSELAQLARVMTLKMGFIRSPVGGAKAAIVGDTEMPLERKRRLLQAFGTALLPLLKGGYSSGAEMGTTEQDIRSMLTSLGMRYAHRLSAGTTGRYVGRTVLAAARAAADQVGLDMGRASIAIQGFGTVGSGVAMVAKENGLNVVAISTSRGSIFRKEGLEVDELLKLYEQCGSRVVESYQKAERIEKGDLLELEVDVLSLCADLHAIHSGNADRVRAKIISPGANVPTTAEAEEILLQKGIVSLPDFVANCGGVLGANMELAGLREGFIKTFIEERIGGEVRALFQAVGKEQVPLREYAEAVAEQRFLETKEKAEKGSITNKVFYFGVGLRRKGLMPRNPISSLPRRYFERRLGRISH